LLLTNGRVIWAFTNHRQFLLLTTIEEGLSPENWQKIAAPPGAGKILLLAGGDLILAEDLR
jgi:hypothetical protein